MMKSYTSKSPFQGAHGNHGDFDSKGRGSKASMVMYRTRQTPDDVGLPSKDSWLINMNSWLKLREKRAAKVELTSFRNLRQRSLTKMAIASGACAGKSLDSLEQMMLGVKREPTSPVICSSLGTPGTFIPARNFGEMEDKIGRKQILRVMPEIGVLYDTNLKRCQFPLTLLEMKQGGLIHD